MQCKSQILAVLALPVLAAGGILVYLNTSEPDPSEPQGKQQNPVVTPSPPHPVTPSSPNAARIDYSRDILPILSQNCFLCHGPDDKKAGLRLDQRELALKPTRSGAVPIQPGKSADSELVRRILAEDDRERMPPPKSKKVLTAAEKDLLKKWIDQGAEYRGHWAFIPPVRPPLPAVKDKAWVKNAIDAFILERLERAGLKPSPRADRTTLIRRLSFDLRGLPPSLQEVDEFLADNSPDAYEKLVDRLLASPHFGEKMAQAWLDLARFGDTSGYNQDSTRQMWLWRDWVIEAFNSNMPYDRFTIEQLAGDLLPKASVSQKIASGFHRNTRFNEENGADPEEFVIRYNVDRTNTLGQVWIGLTLACAECHNHKYDPISQKEYYQLFAYFTGIKEPSESGNHNKPLPPLLKVPSAEQSKALQKWMYDLADLDKEIDRQLTKITYKDPLEGDPHAARPPTWSEDHIWIDDHTPIGARLNAEGTIGWQWGGAPDFRVLSGKRSMLRSGQGLHQHFFFDAAESLEIHARDKLFAHVWLDPKDPPKSIQLQFHDGNWLHRAHWGEDLCIGAGTPNGPQHFHAGPLPEPGKWARLEVMVEQVGLKPGANLDGMAFTQFDGTAYFDQAGIHTLWPPDDRVAVSQVVWETRARLDTRLPADIQAILKVESAKRSPPQKAQVRGHYLRLIHAEIRETFADVNKERAEAARKITEIEDAIPYTLITEEMAEPRPAYVLVRGDFLHKGEKVDRATPAVFPPLPDGKPNNRLGLAHWLVRPDHPLTARVAVNRFWAQMFGAGIVKSLGDFGTQGDHPSHAELLDWLAVEFVQSGWNVKHILKQIALSNAYQQASMFASVPAAKVDPDNRLLSRAPRFRLSAEEIRDNALAISGLLHRKIGGPSFMPYQPPDFYKGKNEEWTWTTSTGEDQYRRGLYAFWRRNALHPMFTVFDAPAREECSGMRPRTNTPLQALVTLNDPTFVEAARVFAQAILTDGPADLDGRLTFAFRTALARAPTPQELDVLRTRYQKQLARYQADKDAASRLVQVGNHPRLVNLDIVELAAWTGVASIILNLDETITRE